MWPSLLFIALWVALVTGQSDLDSQDTTQQFIDNLQRNVGIDWKAPPMALIEPQIEKSCTSWGVTCWWVYFNIRKRLVDEYLDNPFNSTRIPSQPKISIYFNAVVEKSVVNMGDDDITMSVEESKTSIDSTTKGWQIGAQISGQVGLGTSASIGVSGSYSSSHTTGKWDTKGVSIASVCKPGHDCRIETWTFHLRIQGHCRIEPVINCAGDLDPCRRDWAPTCQQFEHYRHKHCLTNPDAVEPYRYEPCEVTTPVLDQAGRPFTRIVRVSQNISKLNRKGRKGHKKGGKANNKAGKGHRKAGKVGKAGANREANGKANGKANGQAKQRHRIPLTNSDKDKAAHQWGNDTREGNTNLSRIEGKGGEEGDEKEKEEAAEDAQSPVTEPVFLQIVTKDTRKDRDWYQLEYCVWYDDRTDHVFFEDAWTPRPSLLIIDDTYPAAADDKECKPPESAPDPGNDAGSRPVKVRRSTADKATLMQASRDATDVDVAFLDTLPESILGR